MSDGQAHVETALALCRSAKEDLSTFVESDQGWISETIARVEGTEATLEGLKDRFFVRSRLCLPFAARCLAEAQELEQAVQALQPDSDGQVAAVGAALSALEKAVRALDSRSAMQGMAIT
jgi:hypothetical protein